ncbi:hypothetical protein [Microbacterium sp. JZ31]|uniref:hypothetical protein n=1 Tax=Microbacterium sp. JZ31 TaxID=1906274 RepID=UPI0019319B77|nr:hypothetical protein [Microbacterium sp. JZ31]
MSTKQDLRGNRVPTGTGESGSIIQEYFPTADARAAGHLAAPPGLYAVAVEDAAERMGTREQLNIATHDQRLRGLVVQMEADIGTGRLKPEAARFVLEERLCQAGIGCDAEQLAKLANLILSERAPTDIAHGEPGASRRL